MNMRELVKNDLEYQQRMKELFAGELLSLPKGSLYVKEKKNRKEFYYVEPKTRKRYYISKSNYKQMENIKRAKVAQIGLKRCEGNIAVEKLFLETFKDIDFASVAKDLPKAYDFEVEVSKKEQKSIQFNGGILHTTNGGLSVRSKSEALIVERLEAVGVEFEYEKELVLKESTGGYRKLLPDFTFTKANEDKIYWEHFGLMKDLGYSSKTFEKLRIYIQNDILPGINLFITADSFDGRIDVGAIYNTIEMIKRLL